MHFAFLLLQSNFERAAMFARELRRRQSPLECYCTFSILRGGLTLSAPSPEPVVLVRVLDGDSVVFLRKTLSQCFSLASSQSRSQSFVPLDQRSENERLWEQPF